jgi:hypothetical protein
LLERGALLPFTWIGQDEIRPDDAFKRARASHRRATQNTARVTDCQEPIAMIQVSVLRRRHSSFYCVALSLTSPRCFIPACILSRAQKEARQGLSTNLVVSLFPFILGRRLSLLLQTEMAPEIEGTERTICVVLLTGISYRLSSRSRWTAASHAVACRWAHPYGASATAPHSSLA